MNTHSKSLIAALLICTPLIVLAAEEPAPQQPPGAPAQADSPSLPMHDQAMADQMRKMQAAHDKIAIAKTPAERQVAMQEGMVAMKEGMAMMQMNCKGKGMHMGMNGNNDAGMRMMDMMMKMMDQQSHMMKMSMGQ
ncbi:hypothetical protein SA496_11515 [Pseudomonas sp. JS3066]|uniref:hypothetical protein n=1 Tax=Pseudomonas sp. JS3066 TaxID=3090665 RepID=UPI002E7C27EA|nr:hypothetical protein [Pseudomonas sp. JS3066]WVK95760.1 hypothetical protein SA496_11515 [Pseudomonas sp. JS3066]